MKQLIETFATPPRQGRWALRVKYTCESVRKTGFEQAMSMATPAQNAILMGLAQLKVGEFVVHVRPVKGFRKMLKRWEGFMEKRERDAANVSLPPFAYIRLKTQLMHGIVEPHAHGRCLHEGRLP